MEFFIQNYVLILSLWKQNFELKKIFLNSCRLLSFIVELIPQNFDSKSCNALNFFTLASAAQASKVVLVYFVGGYTLAEVAAFRLMQANFGMQFIIAGTSNISGKSLMKSILS